jgi:hypothetical protein
MIQQLSSTPIENIDESIIKMLHNLSIDSSALPEGLVELI